MSIGDLSRFCLRKSRLPPPATYQILWTTPDLDRNNLRHFYRIALDFDFAMWDNATRSKPYKGVYDE